MVRMRRDAARSLLSAVVVNDNMTSSAAFTFIRVPLGASDFSARGTIISTRVCLILLLTSYIAYSFDETQADNSLGKFNKDAAPSEVISVLKDIMTVNKVIKVQLLPWSPPGWMKDSKKMNGGSLLGDHIKPCA
jgi:O-glycosyl hydrolase